MASRQDRINRLIERELETLAERTPQSLDLCRRAVETMPLGVPTNVCALDPYPIVVRQGQGAWLDDIDGNRYVDYHGGFGTNVMGHAHPLVTDAICQQAARGVHFGAMTEVVLPWAEHISERWGLDWVRFSNSGTEATMDALRLARAYTGRTKIAKIEGGYHGSHPDALVSGNMAFDGHEGPDTRPSPRLWGEGLSPRLRDEVIPLPFNDLAAAEEALMGGEVAALICEPILFNVGTIFPEKNYLQGLRQLCDRHGTILIFDETKTGATIAWAGAEEAFSVTPHVKTLGKAIGGGLAVGAFGDTDGRLFELIENWRVPHLGTFCGNPLVAAAGRAALEDVLLPAAYEQLTAHYQQLSQGLEEIIATYQLPAYVIGRAAKGCVVWVDGSPLVDFRDYRRRFDFDLGYLAWVYLMNRDVFLAPGQDEQWTHSVAHGSAEATRFLEAFAALADEISDLPRRQLD